MNESPLDAVLSPSVLQMEESDSYEYVRAFRDAYVALTPEERHFVFRVLVELQNLAFQTRDWPRVRMTHRLLSQVKFIRRRNPNLKAG